MKGRLQVPDQIAPIEAYRAWELRADDPTDPLRPLSSTRDETSPWLGAATDLLGYTAEQAASILRVRPSTVRNLASQGRRTLRATEGVRDA